jgi:hypothetical protein
VDEIEHFLPGIGTRHRHVLTNGKTVMKYVSSFVYDPEGTTIISETDEKTKTTIYFIIVKTGEQRSRLSIELYFKSNRIKEVFFNFFEKHKIEKKYLQSLEQLNTVAKATVIPLEF